MPKTKKSNQLVLDITRATRTIYFFIAFFAVSIVIFDSGNLITKEAVVQRWSILTALLVVNTAVWFFNASNNKSITTQKALVGLLVLTLISMAGLVTYWERGMASTSTILYAVPLLVAAIAKNRHALLATATLSAGTYCFASVKYFNDFFNEGFRIQLWGNLVLISGIIFTCAWLIMIIANLRHDSQ